MTALPLPSSSPTARSPLNGRGTRFSSQYQAFPNSIEGSMASWVPMSPAQPTADLDRDDVKAAASPLPRPQSTNSWKPVRMSMISPRTEGDDNDVEWTDPFDNEHQVTSAHQPGMEFLARPTTVGVSESGYSRSSWTGSNPLTTAVRTHSPDGWRNSTGSEQWPRPMSQWQGGGVKPVKMLPTKTSPSGSIVDLPDAKPVAGRGIVHTPSVTEKQRSHSSTPRTRGSRPTEVNLVTRRFIPFNFYLIFRPYLTSIAAIIAAVLSLLAIKSKSSSLSVIFTVKVDDFVTARLPLTTHLAEYVKFGFDGYCLPGGVCFNYAGAEFLSKSGIWLPEASLFTTAECMYAALGGLACLHAAFHTFTAFIQVYLLKSLNLPLGFLTDRQRHEAEAQLDMISAECNMNALFWTWWAHAKSPFGPFLALSVAATATMAFGLTAGFRSALGGNSTLGTGAYTPLAILALTFDPLCHAAMYLGSMSTSHSTFKNGPSSSAALARATQAVATVKEKDHHTKATSKESSTAVPSSSARKPVKSVVPVWSRKPTRKGDHHRRSSGTSFFNTAQRRPTITSAEIQDRTVFDKPAVSSSHPVPDSLHGKGLATPSQASFRTTSSAASVSNKKAVAAQVAPTVAAALPLSADVDDFQSHRMSTADSGTGSTSQPMGYDPSPDGSILSSNSYDNRRWLQEYKKSPALANVMYRLNAGQEYDPYILSDDGLLYNYIPDPNGKPDVEVPRLVPPEGPIRFELIEDAVDDVGEDFNGLPQWKAIMHSLSEKYWWEEMLEDVEGYLGH